MNGGCHFPEFPFPYFKPDGRLTIWDVWAMIETEFSFSDWIVPGTEQSRTSLNFQSVSEPSFVFNWTLFPPFIRNNISTTIVQRQSEWLFFEPTTHVVYTLAFTLNFQYDLWFWCAVSTICSEDVRHTKNKRISLYNPTTVEGDKQVWVSQ